MYFKIDRRLMISTIFWSEVYLHYVPTNYIYFLIKSFYDDDNCLLPAVMNQHQPRLFQSKTAVITYDYSTFLKVHKLHVTLMDDNGCSLCLRGYTSYPQNYHALCSISKLSIPF